MGPGPAAEEPDGSGGPHFVVADVDVPVLADADRHHAARVLRLRPGDPLTVTDGLGRWRPARFGDGLEVDGPVVVVPEPAEAVTVGFALVKGGKPELVVQKLVELGVDRIVAFAADRSVVRWEEDRVRRARRRWAEVARAAVQQCRRVRVPDIEAVSDFGSVARPPAVLADRDGRAPRRGDRFVLVGPEGGWSDTERECGLDRVRFARHTLRAETAAIGVAAILTAMRDGRIGPMG